MRTACAVTVTMPTTCVSSGTMALEVRPAEVERHKGALYSLAPDLTVTKHLDQVATVCLSIYLAVCLPTCLPACLSVCVSLSACCLPAACLYVVWCLLSVCSLFACLSVPACLQSAACLFTVFCLLSVCCLCVYLSVCLPPVCLLSAACLSIVWCLLPVCCFILSVLSRCWLSCVLLNPSWNGLDNLSVSLRWTSLMGWTGLWITKPFTTSTVWL